MLRSGLLALLVLGSGIGACREGPSRVPGPVRDAGPRPPVDAAVLTSLVERYVAVADAQGDERCRCAGDLAVCRRQLEADWDDAGRACLVDAFALQPAGFETAISCLELAVADLASCHAPLACASVDARTYCIEAWSADGSACLSSLETPSKVALVACTAYTEDAGSP